MVIKTFQAFIADGQDPPSFFNKFVTASKVIEKYYNNSLMHTKQLFNLFGSVGYNVQVGERFVCDIGENIFIGNNVSIGNDVVVLDIGKVSIGNNTIISDNVHLYNAGHEKNSIDRWRCCKFSEITIGTNVKIGARTVVLPGTCIMDNVIIESGSVVRGYVPDGTHIYGNEEIVSLHKIIENDLLNHVTISLDSDAELSSKIKWLSGKCNIIRIGLRYRNGNNIYGGYSGFGLINANATFDDAEQIFIGDYCLMGPGVKLLTDISKNIYGGDLINLIRNCSNSSIKSKGRIIIGDNVFISGNVIVTPGIKIGNNSVIFSPNGIVTKDVPDNSVLANGENGYVVEPLNMINNK
ncbi:MAG: hypothetical protein HQK89_04605 [Nitrospirae bacterium]|nr:hypothetical protein [Nitrospirota bacterium]